jgi:hypothetical protein
MEVCWRLRYVGINDCYIKLRFLEGGGGLPKVEFSISIYFYILPETLHSNKIVRKFITSSTKSDRKFCVFDFYYCVQKSGLISNF